MLTQQETDNLFRLLVSKDIKNITLGLEIAKANHWQIDKVGEALEQLFNMLALANKKILDTFIKSTIFSKVEMEDVNSIKMLTIDNKNIYPLEIILAALPNIIRFLPWQGKIKAKFELHYAEMGDGAHGYEHYQDKEDEWESWKLIYETLARKTQLENLQDINELKDYILLANKCSELLDNSSEGNKKIFKATIENKKTYKKFLSVLDNEENSWFWETPNILRAVAKLNLYTMTHAHKNMQIVYEEIWKETDFLTIWKIFIAEFIKKRFYTLDSDIEKCKEFYQESFRRQIQKDESKFIIGSFKKDFNNTEILGIFGKIEDE